MRPLIITAAVLASVLTPAIAHAGLDACGDIHLQANAQCEVVAEGCDAECTPLSVEAACAAELQASCDASCSLDASVSCTGSCRASCETECNIDPGSFDCQASCQGDCSASCDAVCDGQDSSCWASCEATCSSECSASCEVTPPQADCVTQCEACCGGSCSALANLDCQVGCQAEGFAECQVDVSGGCEADCSEAGGALFCDGQYVDHGNNLEQCVEAIESLLDGEVEGNASLSCSAGECEFGADGLFSCSVDRGARPGGALGFAVLLGLGLFGVRRRR